ncbi:diguanylate cyclase domain-containing protein [Nitrincola alkalisediminis]|uniref:diguanylate cyclase domain-containing protein n=1 Tax=Nitrincola alkalisediminis TaxID=1366656 RepID=UPI001CA81BEC|nr:diguanylate cyclase [Nitrincola alkalisediminis]
MPPTAFGLEKVSLQLKWTHAFQFAGYYAAIDQGFYEQAGLDVSLIEGAPGINATQQVVSRQADFGVGTSGLLLDLDQGNEVVLLANIFQHSPQVIISKADTALQSIHTLADKPIMLEEGSDELLAYLMYESIFLEQDKRLPHTFSIEDLITGKVDAMSAYITHEPYYLDLANFRYHIYTPRSVGIDFYGDNLFTSKAFAQQRPDIVSAFTQASLKGWTYALQNPDYIIELILEQYTQTHSASFLQFEASRMHQLIKPELIEIGYINPGRWAHIHNTYQSLNLVSSPLDLSEFLFKHPSNTSTSWFAPLIISSLIASLVSGIALYIYRVNLKLNSLLRQKNKAAVLQRHRNTLLEMIAADQPIEQILQEIVLSVEAYNPKTFCSILLFHSDTETLHIGAAPSLPQEYNQAINGVKIGPAVGACGSAAYFKKRVITADIAQHPFWKDYKHLSLKHGLKACWSEPIMRKNGHLLGTFAIYHTKVSEPTSDDIQLIRESAQLAEIAIERHLAYDELRRSEERHRHLAQHDPLTGLANRSLFSDRLNQSLKHAKRHSSSFAVLLIDLNGFKPINDEFGHNFGDLVLKEVATRLKAIVRESDTVSRIGGDEFVILLHNVDSRAAAQQVVDKIHQAFTDPFCEPDSVNLSCSIGIALYPDDGATEIELTQVADIRMYQNKQGR